MNTAAVIASASPEIGYLLVIFALAVVLLWINDRIIHRKRKRKKTGAAKSFAERLNKPDFGGLEKQFGCKFPAAVKALYENKPELEREIFEVIVSEASDSKRSWGIAFYQPADLESIVEAQPDAKEVFAFANDGCGNEYTIDPRLDDPPVMFHDHETNEWEPVATKFSKFMAMKRQE